AAEMVEPHQVEEGERSAETLNPPPESVGLQHIPAIDRIAPKLPGGAEVVGRHAGHHGRMASIVEVEEFRVGPDVCAVVRHVDGNVAHQADVALPAIGLEVSPLAEKLELPVLDDVQLGRKTAPPFADCVRFAAANLCVPCTPSGSIVYVLYGQEEREVVEPGTGVFTEMVEGSAIRTRSIGKESLCCPEQCLSLEFDRRPKVDRVLRKGRCLSQVRFLEQSLIPQPLKAQQQRVAGESREALVGRIAVSSGIQRQHLPQLLPGSVQEVGEFVSTWPEIADAKAARQRSAMQQNTADSWEFHAANIRWLQLHGQAQGGARTYAGFFQRSFRSTS